MPQNSDLHVKVRVYVHAVLHITGTQDVHALFAKILRPHVDGALATPVGRETFPKEKEEELFLGRRACLHLVYCRQDAIEVV